MNETDPILYILMRTDLPSMNAGKAMAQASHAANALESASHSFGKFGTLKVAFDTWKEQTSQGFGTCIVLGATIQQINEIVGTAPVDVAARKIVDPTYPYIVDGEIANVILGDNLHDPHDNHVLLVREETTCAFVFGDKKTVAPLVAELNLHP